VQGPGQQSCALSEPREEMAARAGFPCLVHDSGTDSNAIGRRGGNPHLECGEAGVGVGKNLGNGSCVVYRRHGGPFVQFIGLETVIYTTAASISPLKRRNPAIFQHSSVELKDLHPIPMMGFRCLANASMTASAIWLSRNISDTPASEQKICSIGLCRSLTARASCRAVVPAGSSNTPVYPQRRHERHVSFFWAALGQQR
jgi:hypothetical protein